MDAHLILATALILLLGFTAWGDIRRRDIPNWIVILIAVAAPLWWWSTGIAWWPDAAIRVGIAALVFLVFTGAWAIRMMGGGDVKLLGATALWLAPLPLLDMLTVMAIAGGVLTLLIVVLHRARRSEGSPEVPYGVAIAGAVAWTVANQILTIHAG